MPQAEPFTVAVPDEDIADLHRRLDRTRFPADFANEDWRFGMNREYLESFLHSWRHEFDWRETEARINSYNNYKVDFEGVPVHFIHERGKGPNPMPLILTHGWPWTFWDFEQVIRPLTDPAAHGGDPADAFDVIVPSLPGFGFSTPLRVDGLQTSMAVDLWARLMTDILGYERFAAGGGDFGAMLSGTLAYRYPERVLGVYLTLPSLPQTAVPANLPEPGSTSQLVGMLMGPAMRTSRDDFAPEERHRYDTMEERWRTALSHIAVHTTDPQTLAFALHDSPAGLASWLVERRRNWSDNDGNVEEAFSRQFLLDTVSIYWFTESFVTTSRWYWHTFRTPPQAVPDPEAARKVPLGLPVYPKEMIFVPRAAAEASGNVVHWTEQPRGGHFAPSEVPDLFVEDIRAFYRKLR